MKIGRRALLGNASAALFAPRVARAQTVTDAAGRAVPIPAKVTRVFPAGPPAAIVLYTLAPDLLLGWPRANRREECEFMLPDVCARPEVGRITGRGNTANLEVVLALKPDLILDVGATSPTFVSLATRVQEQTGISYALLDGRFDAAVETYRKLGELTHRRQAGEALAGYTAETMSTLRKRVDAIPQEKRPAFIMRAARAASKPGLAARSTSRPSSSSALAMSRPGARAGSRWCRSSRSCCGIPTSSSPSIAILR